MKDGLNAAAVQRIARAVLAADPGFQAEQFSRSALEALDGLELKQRVSMICELLSRELPADFRQLARVLEQIPLHWDGGDPDDNLRGFAAWPIIELVPHRGMEHPELALPLLARLTPLFTSEFAVRPFIKRYPQQSLNFLEACCESPDEHVRRWASEGSRPLLPWGMHLTEIRDNPHMTADILQKMRRDPSKYVQKSVANHLNDIGKNHPDLLIQTCQKWLAEDHPNSNWVCRHALRSLIKRGDARVFPLLGYDDAHLLQVDEFLAKGSEPKKLTLEARIKNPSERPIQLRLDYSLEIPRLRGKTGQFVFFWADRSIQPGEQVNLSKVHDFRPISTRRYYPGSCKVELRLNGQGVGQLDFELKENLTVCLPA